MEDKRIAKAIGHWRSLPAMLRPYRWQSQGKITSLPHSDRQFIGFNNREKPIDIE